MEKLSFGKEDSEKWVGRFMSFPLVRRYTEMKLPLGNLSLFSISQNGRIVKLIFYRTRPQTRFSGVGYFNSKTFCFSDLVGIRMQGKQRTFKLPPHMQPITEIQPVQV